MDEKKGAEGGEEKATKSTEDMESVDLTEEDVNLIEAFHELKLRPELGGAEDLVKFLKRFNKREDEKDADKLKPTKAHTTPSSSLEFPTLTTSSTKIKTEDASDYTSLTGTLPSTTASASPIRLTGSYHFPKLSNFYGEENKGDVTYEAFKFEVQSLLSEKVFTEAQVLLGMRRALRGTASDIVRRLGTGVTVAEILKKLDSTYGNIESQETVMKKFYSCTQETDSINTYAAKLEELYSQAIDLGAINRREELLKQVLYQGLRIDLKHIAQYKFATIPDYDAFKIELRKMEAEMKTDVKTKTCHTAQKMDKEENTEMKELRSMLQQLNEKFDNLQKEKDMKEEQRTTYGFGSRPYRRGYFNRGNFTGRGRGRYIPTRPLASTTFQGTCYRCNQRGHLARNCRTDLKDLENQGKVTKKDLNE